MNEDEYIIQSELPIDILQLYIDSSLNFPDLIGVYAIDKQYNFILFNKIYKKHIKKKFGIDIKIGDNYIEKFLAKNNLEKEKKILSQALQGSKLNHVGYYFENEDKFYFQNFYKPILNKNQEVIGVVVQCKDLTPKKRKDIIWNTILNISEKANETEQLSDFIENLRNELSKIVDTENFFIALYNKSTNRYKFPFYKDKYDEIKIFEHQNLDNSITDYVRRTGKPFILDNKKLEELEKKKIIKLYGTHSSSWLGIPLKVKQEVIGVLVLQNYEKPNHYRREDLEIMTLISNYLANTIQRKQTEDKLYHTTKHLKQAMKIARMGVVKIKPDDNEVKLSNEILEILDLPKHFSSTTLKEFKKLIHPEDIPAFTEFIDKVKFINTIYSNEFRILSKATKQYLYIYTKAEINKTEYPYDIEIVLLMQDLTKQHKDKLVLEKAKENAERSNKLKSTFMANISHEIKTPLNSILSFSKFLKEEQFLSANTIKEYADYIQRSANNLLEIINEILDTAKIKAGEFQLTPRPTDLHKLLDDLKKSFKIYQKNNQKENIKLILKKEKNTPNFFIEVDEIFLKQILSNLLNNALKFTTQGSIEYGYKITTPQTISFYVKDTGQGISNSKRDKVFSRYGQINSSQIIQPKDAGLGLAIAKKLTEAMGGEISFTYEINKGTTFTFTIPLCIIKKNKIQNNKKTECRNIIIFENNKLNIKLFTKLFELQNKKYKILFMQDLISIEKLDKMKFDALLINLNYENAESYIWKFRKTHNNKEIPVIGIVNYADKEDIEKVKKLGFNDLISKPYTFDNLFSILSKHIN